MSRKRDRSPPSPPRPVVRRITTIRTNNRRHVNPSAASHRTPPAAPAAAPAASAPSTASANSPSTGTANARNRIEAGNFGSILARLLDNQQQQHPSRIDSSLIGALPTVSSDPITFQSLQRIATFLRRHQLAQAASDTAEAVPTNNTTTTTTTTSASATPESGGNVSAAANPSQTVDGSSIISTASYYQPALQDFCQSQWERQAAGLRTNTSTETAQGSIKVVESHRRALQSSLQAHQLQTNTTTTAAQASLFTSNRCCAIHARLCPNHPQSGQLRVNRVRAGNTYFGAPQRVPEEMDRVWQGLTALEEQWGLSSDVSSGATEGVFLERVYHAVGLAAITLYALNDVHPFADGNGRMSRIYANALLNRYLHLPFPITIVATPQQRNEYVEGLRNGRVRVQNLMESSSSEIVSTSGAMLQSLVRMLLDRMISATVQLQSLLDERARLAMDEEEARIGRRIRERAAQHGQCVICLDSNPNIATLCCGQAVHLNCMAEWLANGSTCVSCRNPLPRLTLAARQERGEETRRGGAEQNLHEAFQAMQDVIQDAINLQNRADGLNEGDVDPHETTEADVQPPEETTTTTTSDVDDTTTEVAAAAPPRRPQCTHCNNVAASECPNRSCARCCINHGYVVCRRHGRNNSPTSTTEDSTTSDDDHDNTTTTVDDTTTSDDDRDNTTTTVDDTTTSDDSNEGTTADDTTTSDKGNDSTTSADGNGGTTTFATSDADDSGDSATTSAAGHNQRVGFCARCERNRAAQDCSNNMCGRCCVLTGMSYLCPRHQ